MNERIKELASQAGVTYDWDPGTGGPEVYFDRQEDFEKFAELIVRECASLFADDLRTMGDFTERACRRAIKEHFGVEE
jgi:hypothetical protein